VCFLCRHVYLLAHTYDVTDALCITVIYVTMTILSVTETAKTQTVAIGSDRLGFALNLKDKLAYLESNSPLGFVPGHVSDLRSPPPSGQASLPAYMP